jgi:hypothetical protein
MEESRRRNPSDDMLVAIASFCITVSLITLENFSAGSRENVAIPSMKNRSDCWTELRRAGVEF